MDMPWGDPKNERFTTGVGLITSDGPHGPNIMACEGTHLVSYQPARITISVGNKKPTWENIKKTKEFGVSLASVDQMQAIIVAGKHSAKNLDKIAVLKAIGVKLLPSKHIKPMLVDGAALHAECKVVDELVVGDHTLFVGEVLAVTRFEAEPVVYRQGQLFKPVPIPWKHDAKVEEAVRKHTRGGA